MNISNKQEANEEKKAYLWQYSEAKKDMEREELLYREAMVAFYPSYSIGGEGGGGSHEHKDLSDRIIREETIRKRYLKKRYLRLKILTEIKDAIERLDNSDEKNVLVYRYILLKKWDEICLELDISWKQIHRIHSRALEHFEIPHDRVKNIKKVKDDME